MYSDLPENSVYLIEKLFYGTKVGEWNGGKNPIKRGGVPAALAAGLF